MHKQKKCALYLKIISSYTKAGLKVSIFPQIGLFFTSVKVLQVYQ